MILGDLRAGHGRGAWSALREVGNSRFGGEDATEWKVVARMKLREGFVCQLPSMADEEKA